MQNIYTTAIKFESHILTLSLILSQIFCCANKCYSQFQLNGSASAVTCKCYQLNPDMNNVAGSVWNINKIDLNQPFDFNFTVNVGCNSSQWAGADGMVFGLQPLSTSIGSAGGQMGLGGVTPSLGVFIDTWQNTNHSDPFNDHISMNLNGDVIHTSSNNIAGPYDLGEIENCLYEPLRVTWNPTTTVLNVYYNNLMVLTYSGDIINNVFGGDPLVYWGFTASTGGASNFHQFCLDVPDVIIDNSNLVLEDEKCDQQNGSITGLNITGGIPPYSWTWNGISSINTDTSNLESGNYSLDVIDGLGCATAQTFIIEDLAAPVIDSSNVFLKNEDCGQQNGYIQNLSIISNADSLQYFWNGILNDSLDINNVSANTYQLIAIDNNNCSDSVTFIISDTNYHNILVGYYALSLAVDEPIDFYETMTLDSSVSTTWSWTFGDGDTSNLSNPTHTYAYSGEYTICLRSSNEYNCSDSNCITIELLPNEIIVPNIFTPNGDNTNDQFEIQGINDRFQIQIFNRWGQLVFEQNPYSNNWEGINKTGQPLNNGIYYYLLKNKVENVEKNGNFRLTK
ncbi:MAG: lectin-like domain-containing protein [Parvicellaceae bacterium]